MTLAFLHFFLLVMFCHNKQCGIIEFDPYWIELKRDETCPYCKKPGHKTKG